MEDQLVIRIGLGNAEMSEPDHVVDALLRLIARIQDGYSEGVVRDVNGNSVGEWTVDWPEVSAVVEP